MCWDSLNVEEELKGKTLVSMTGKEGEDEMFLVTDTGDRYKFHHEQDCCESVEIYDICGDFDDLVGSPLLDVREETSNENPPESEYGYDSFTWTFYVFRTIKGSVTVRCFGTSNGYYSESKTTKP